MSEGPARAGAARSEVAALRERIKSEYEACFAALNAPAITAPHKVITQRINQHWENIAGYQEQLVEVVGANAATIITGEALASASPEGRTGSDKTRAEIVEMMNRMKYLATSAYQSCIALCTASPDPGTTQATLKSYFKDVVGIQQQLSILVGPTAAQDIMFEAMEGLESPLLEELRSVAL